MGALSTPGSPAKAPSRPRAPWWTFLLVSAAGVVMTLDVTVVNIALFDIARDLDTGLGKVQWVISAYSLAFGALLLTGGALSDRVGRRAVFVTGTTLFTLASAACGLAPDAATLIVARAVQGLGGALMFAPALALLATVYEDEARRRAAIAAFAAISSGAGALGPVVGGVFVQGPGWRWIFLVNIPIGVLIVVGALARMPESSARGATARRVDVPGALLAVGALLALHYPLVAGTEHGWTTPGVIGSTVLGLVLVVALVRSQRRGDGLLDLALLRIRAFSGAAVLGFLARVAGLGSLAFITLWLATAYAYSPLETGLHLLPLTGSLLVVGVFVARLQRAFPPHSLVAAGFALKAVGLLGLAAAGAGAPRAVTVAGLLLLGAGGAVVFPPLMGVAVGAVPADRTGMASGLTNACLPLGTAAGVAVFGAVFSAHLAARLGSDEELRAAVATARFDLVPEGSRAAARDAFTDAFTTVCLTAAVVCALGVLAARTLRPAAETD
ncbi:MFS transporter [Streptomyces sp. NPDC020412]|uniref:MFS transporter n=1 Tax=Streptomyces sp. NPDC020412 TaxID=3365073 RepID=UPI00379315CE